MTTPAYTPYVDANPITSLTRQNIVDSTRQNLLALRDAVAIGHQAGWTASVTIGTGTAEEPQFKLWTKSATGEVFRATFTYSSGYVTQIVWDWSNDSGATYSNVDTVTVSYDGSGNTTGGNNGSIWTWLTEWIGKLKALRTLFNTHTATTGTGVHGLGGMSTQSAAAVAITGGTMDGVVIGGSTAAAASVQTLREKAVSLGSITGSVALDWSAAGGYYGTVTGNTTFSFSNLPASGLLAGLTLELTNPGAFTITWPSSSVLKWPSGIAPANTAAGVDILEFYCRDGSTVRGAQAQKNSS